MVWKNGGYFSMAGVENFFHSMDNGRKIRSGRFGGAGAGVL